MDMEQWARVRRKILIEKRSKRSVMKEEELHWETLQKMLAHSTPPGYRRSKKPKRKVDAYRDWIAEVLRSDHTTRQNLRGCLRTRSKNLANSLASFTGASKRR